MRQVPEETSGCAREGTRQKPKSPAKPKKKGQKEMRVTTVGKNRIAIYGPKTVLFGALLILSGCTREATASLRGDLQVDESLGVEVTPVNLREAPEIERGLAAFGRAPNGGLVVTTGPAAVHRHLIIALAAQHRLPAVYYARLFPAAGGLISYGADYIDQYQRAAGAVILH